MQTDQLFDAAATGAYIGGNDKPIAVQTLAIWRCHGDGPKFLKVGRLVRYRQRDLDDWLAQGRRSSTSEGAAA